MSAPALVAAPLALEARALRRGAPGLRVVRTGMGPLRSLRAVDALLRDPAPRLAIAGVCGALEGDLAAGDVVVASRLRTPRGREHTADAEGLLAALAEAGLTARAGLLLSSDHVVRGDERRRLGESGALAVDMESAWLAEGAGARPLAVLRVVVDGPGRELGRPGVVRDGWRALRKLRAAAPALARWAHDFEES